MNDSQILVLNAIQSLNKANNFLASSLKSDCISYIALNKALNEIHKACAYLIPDTLHGPITY